jgi:hypothetical protein
MLNKFTVLKVTSLVLALGLVLYFVSGFARPADIVTSLPNPIPADRTAPFTIYFPYGNPNGDIDIRNAVASLNLTGQGFEIVNTGIADLYYGSPTRSDATPPPDVPACNNTYNGPVYPISSSLATTTSLTYGLQSARTPGSPSGATTATLREKATGCIRVDIRVAPGAQNGQTAQLIFDEDSANSPDYQEPRRPARRIVNMQVGAPTGESNNPTNPGNPGSPTNPGTPGNPTNPGNPGDPLNPGNPGSPTNPGTPGNPTNPGNPGDPFNPGNPGNPTNPGTPGNPTNPGNPGDPLNPGNPGDPTNPGTPGNPTNPGNPGDPFNPGNPGDPIAFGMGGTGTPTTSTSTGTSNAGGNPLPRTGGVGIISLLTALVGVVAGVIYVRTRKSLGKVNTINWFKNKIK